MLSSDLLLIPESNYTGFFVVVVLFFFLVCPWSHQWMVIIPSLYIRIKQTVCKMRAPSPCTGGKSLSWLPVTGNQGANNSGGQVAMKLSVTILWI